MKRFLGIFVLILFLLASCGGKKEVKKETEESKIAKEAFAVVEVVKNAYIKKDTNTIEKNATKDGLAAITSDIRKFDSVDFIFKPVLVEIEPDKVMLNVSWQGKWQKGANTIDERGMAIFILKDKPLRVDKILRTNPFDFPE